MKKKTFILTLMLLICSTLFGEGGYWPEPPQNLPLTMMMNANIKINGVVQNSDNLEIAAFCNGEIRGTTKTTIINGESNVFFTVRANSGGEKITFKLYVPGTGNNEGKVLGTDYTMAFVDDGFVGFDPLLYIDFYEKHWDYTGNYENNMTVECTIKINGVTQERTDLELAAFCGNEIRGVAKPQKYQISSNQYVYLTALILGGKNNDNITFKLYDPILDEELSTEYTVKFVKDATIGDETPLAIDFLSSSFSYVAQIGEDKYVSFDAALAAAQDGDEIILLANINLAETAVVSRDINIALNGKTVTGTIELANAGATVTGTQNAVTSVVTNIADHKVVYEGGMYKVVAKVYVAQVGSTKYETIQAAVNAATAGQTVTIIANVSGEAVEANKNITITDNGELTLNNVSINAVEGTNTLTVSNLSFTGNSWINSGAASELVVSGVTADVTPSNASVTNSRSAFISLGRSEQKTLELTVENSSIIARGGSDAILGWAAITEANLTGNTFGSASAYQTSSDCVKFMAIANNAVLNIINNNVYSNYNGIVFGQNTTRDNAYTANVSGNNFYGGADHIWIEVSGSNTCHATINATSSNKVNGNAFTANDIKVHPNLNTWTSYGGVDVVFDSNNKIIGGTFKYIADSVIAEGYEKSANTDGTYGIVKSISGEIAYRAYINDTEAREAVQVDLTNIIAKQSVVVKLYDANGNALTTTSLKAGAAEAANLTCNIVLQGTASGSWKTTINATLTVENIPAKIELWIDGTLKDTFENALGAGTNVDETAKYIALDCVYKEARIGNTYYATINNAIAAAQDDQTIVLLADVTLANAIDITGKTLDLNGKTVKADIIGTVKTNGGLWITSTGHKMLGSGADIYATENATVINSANEVNIVSGAITLATTEWWTLQNQNLTIGSGATFTIPAASKFNVMNGTTVMVNGTAINNGTLAIYGTAIVNGTLTVNGQIILANKNATLKAVDGLNVTTNIADYKVVYENSMYKVVAKVYVAQVGETKYESLEEAIAAVPANQTITVLKDITLAQTLTIAAEKNFTLDLNGKAINTGFQQNSTDKHIYAFDNKGTLTLANGTINARGIYNYGTLTVNANATINSIDANGGYGVGNYGTLNVYGTIATTNENGDTPEEGNYDATPIVNNAGATINVYEGSKITNVSNYTYALDNKGTAIIKGGSFSSGHTTVGNSGTMTIEGGSFVCNGAEGVTSHAFIAEAGTTTIIGGTFDGKDNYNGFNVCASEGATVIIEGGNFLSCHSGSLYGNGAIEVSGGKFFDAVPENRCATGYIPTQFTDGTYGVKAGSYIAQIGTTKYETFEEAYAAAQAGDVIELFRTVVLTSNNNYEKQVTVKSAFGETAFRVKAEVSFNNMAINSDDYCVIVGASDGAGKLTINGGTYNGETTAVSVTKGEVNINGGTFKVEPYQDSYEYTINCIDANYNNQTAKVAIQGGKFYSFNPMNNAAEGAGTNFVVANHITVKDAENYWTVVALPTTNQIVSSADHTVTSEGYGPATVTVTGEVPCVNGQGVVSSWIGFRITKPQGIDANVARVFTPGSNGTYNEKTLASILDEGQDYASMWVSIQYKRVFDYKVDWNNDGVMDLVINIDATAATIKHNYVVVERVEPSYGQDGYIKYQCGCGHVYIETLPAEKVAQIGETKYTTLEAAAAAAQTGETIVLLADVTLANVETTSVTLPENVTLDLNGKTVKADIIGTVKTNGGLWITSTGHKMLGSGADIYATENATVINSANEVNIVSGAITLATTEWWTLQNQNLTIGSGATFTIPATSKFNVMNGTTVTVKGAAINNGTLVIYGTAIVDGTITVNGTVELTTLTATLKAQEGLNVITNIEGYKVVYENGTYSLATMDAYFKGGAYARYVASKDREHFSITLGEVYAKESLVVKVYSAGTLLLTTTYRAEDLDNPGVNRYPVISDKLTVNNVVSGKEAGSWLNEYAQGIELTIANVPDKFEVYADGVLKDTYDGTQSELKGFGSEKDLNTYLGFEGVYKAASITNTSGTEYYMTLAEALADVKKDDVLNLYDDATIANPINVTSNLTINGNNHTLTYTGANRAIDVTAGNFTAENLTIVANGERGINYNVANGQLTLNNVEVEGKSTYAINLPGLSDGAKVVINNSSLTGKIALNVWGENTTITTTNSHFTSVDETEAEDYAAIAFNNDGNGTSCAGTTIVMDGGSIIAKDQNGNPSVAVSNSAAVNFKEGVNYSVNNATRIVGEIKTPVAIVTYEGQNAFYSCYTFQDAIDEAIETKGSVKLLTNVASSEIITINGKVNIDGNGKTLTSTATRAINVATEGEVNISNLIVVGTDKTERAINVIEEAANLTLNNVKAEGFKYTINVAASSVGSEIKTNGGKFSGYAAVNITGDNTTFTSNETEFVGVNNVPAGSTNAFAAIVIGDYVSGNTTDDVVVTINGGNVTSTSANGNAQSIVQVTAAKDAQVTVKAALSLCNENVFYTDCINEVTAKFPADYADELNAQGYATSTPVDGLVTVLGDAVAEIVETGVNYATLAEAVTAATSGQTIKLLWVDGNAPIAMNASLYGKNVTITGTATVDWSKGFLFVGRGGEGNATLTFNNANLTSASNSASYGIHVSGREKNTNNKYDGTVEIKNSTIVLDYLINKGTMTLDNSTFTVKNGFAVGGRPASETENGEDATATITLNNGSNLVVNNHNGMGLGYEAKGVMNIDNTSSFETTQSFLVTAKGAMNIAGTAVIAGTLTNDGAITLTDVNATLKAQSGLNVITNIANYAVAYENGTYKVVQSIYEQRQILGAGWNWFSSYINISGEEGLEAIETALGTSGLQIKGQLGFVDYSSEWGWNGTLVSASVEEMFMIQTSEQVELVLTGKLANPATPITLQKNWTYIGYPVSEPMNLKDALANITPNDGDIIKTHNGEVAQYYAESNTWYTQSLLSMTPGLGYMYRNTSGVTKTLVYPTPNANTRAEVRANVTSENNHWLPNASAFANNMNIIAVLENNDMMGEFEVAAFVNGEVRGSARPTYVEPIDAYVLFMTIYGEEGDELTFKYYDIYSDEEHSINNTVNYSDNAVIGSIKAPYMFFANTLGMEENAANTLSLYPNPTTTNAAISFETIYDIVEVFNSLGVKVAEYRNVDRIEGIEAAGVYVIRVTNDSAVQNCRLIVK